MLTHMLAGSAISVKSQIAQYRMKIFIITNFYFGLMLPPAKVDICKDIIWRNGQSDQSNPMYNPHTYVGWFSNLSIFYYTGCGSQIAPPTGFGSYHKKIHRIIVLLNKIMIYNYFSHFIGGAIWLPHPVRTKFEEVLRRRTSRIP